MGRKFQIYLVCLLAVAVCIGGVAILYPLISQGIAEPYIPQVTAPQVETEDPETQPEKVPEVTVTTPSKVEPLPIPDSADPEILAMLEEMTLEEKLYQMFFVTPEAITGVTTATAAGPATEEALAEYPVGGIIYFAQNLEDTDQITTMLTNTQYYSETPIFLGVDEEGGTVARLGNNPKVDVTRLQSMSQYDDPQQVYEMGKTMGDEMAALGFNVNFAPVADVVTNPNNTEIGDRAFSDDPAEAATLVASMVEGLEDTDVSATLKHFPGHGSTETDTHDGASISTRTYAQLQENEFLPFQAGIEAGADLVMVGHQIMSGIGEGLDDPACLSEVVVSDLLRGELGFTGVIITDAMNMSAIADIYSSGEAAVAAVYAGVDMILMPADLEAAIAGLTEAIENGHLTEDRIDQSVYRILSLKMEKNMF